MKGKGTLMFKENLFVNLNLNSRYTRLTRFSGSVMSYHFGRVTGRRHYFNVTKINIIFLYLIKTNPMIVNSKIEL